MVSDSYWLRTQPSWLWAPQPGFCVPVAILYPMVLLSLLVEIWTNEGVSSTASPQFLCQSSIPWCRYSHWLKTQRLRFVSSSLVESSTYESVSSSASLLFLTPAIGAPFSLVDILPMRAWAPQPVPSSCVCPASIILIGWQFSLWERELLSQSPVPVSVLYLVAALYRHLKAIWIPSSFLLKPFLLYSMSKCWYN